MDPGILPARAATRDFYLRSTRTVAKDLLGAWMVRRWRGKLYGARIVEVEAYLGERDAAAHSFGGRRTARVLPMYGEGGLLYIFQVYGLHFCANAVTRRAGMPEAVLLRAARHPRTDPRLLAGPGKLCAAFGIAREHSGIDLVDSPKLEIRPDPVPRSRIAVSPRIGVDYAGEARHWPLRYWIAGDPGVSRTSTPRPSSARLSRKRTGG